MSFISVHHLKKIGVLLLGIGMVAAFQTEAMAGPAVKLGDVIDNTNQPITSFSNVLDLVAYVSGLFMAIWGIFKFKDHVDSPSNHPLSAGIKRFLAGGMMLTMPYMYNVLHTTLMAGGSNKITGTARHAAPTGTGMDKMIYDFVANVAGPAEKMLLAFTYIAAIGLLILGISRLTKTAQDGPRGPTGMGTIMTFLASGALFSFADMMGNFSSSLFGDASITRYAQIDPKVLNAADANQVAPVIEAVMAFIMIVGYIAFIRGWFVLKAFADGSNSATLAQGLTFLFGGALAINLGELVNVLGNTVGVSSITFK